MATQTENYHIQDVSVPDCFQIYTIPPSNSPYHHPPLTYSHSSSKLSINRFSSSSSLLLPPPLPVPPAPASPLPPRPALPRRLSVLSPSSSPSSADTLVYPLLPRPSPKKERERPEEEEGRRLGLWLDWEPALKRRLSEGRRRQEARVEVRIVKVSYIPGERRCVLVGGMYAWRLGLIWNVAARGEIVAGRSIYSSTSVSPLREPAGLSLFIFSILIGSPLVVII